MKYIKTFENQEEYKVGDWIFLKGKDFDYEHLDFIEFIDDTPCKIIKIYKGKKDIKSFRHYDCEYIESPNPDLISFTIRDVPYFSINKKLTPEEVKDYQIKIDAKKYNL